MLWCPQRDVRVRLAPPASLLACRRGRHGGDCGRRLLAGPDLRRHPVLRVTDAFDFALEGVSPVRDPFFFVARTCFELAAERAFRAGHLKSCNLFWHADVSGVCSYRGGLSDEGIRYRV